MNGGPYLLLFRCPVVPRIGSISTLGPNRSLALQVAAQRRRNRSSIARDNHLLYFRRIAAMLVTHLDYD
jgi:hypothetical protein